MLYLLPCRSVLLVNRRRSRPDNMIRPANTGARRLTSARAENLRFQDRRVADLEAHITDPRSVT